jgi:hypothetical protein
VYWRGAVVTHDDEFALSFLRDGAWVGQTVLLNSRAGDLKNQPVRVMSITDGDLVVVELQDGATREIPPSWLWLSIRDEYNPLLKKWKELDLDNLKPEDVDFDDANDG